MEHISSLGCITYEIILSNIFSSACGNIVSNGMEIEDVNLEVLIYPNPITSDLIIESKNLIKSTRIINELGQVVLNNNDVKLSYRINTENWAEGFYYILINFSNHQSFVGKVIRIN